MANKSHEQILIKISRTATHNGIINDQDHLTIASFVGSRILGINGIDIWNYLLQGKIFLLHYSNSNYLNLIILII